MDMPWTWSKTGSISYGKDKKDHSESGFSHEMLQLIGQITSQSAHGTCLHMVGQFSAEIFRAWMVVNQGCGLYIGENWCWLIKDVFWRTRKPTGSIYCSFSPFFYIYIYIYIYTHTHIEQNYGNKSEFIMMES